MCSLKVPYCFKIVKLSDLRIFGRRCARLTTG
nr:MAG TPA: hypothetical protein [Caudoviricetes sp.]